MKNLIEKLRASFNDTDVLFAPTKFNFVMETIKELYKENANPFYYNHLISPQEQLEINPNLTSYTNSSYEMEYSNTQFFKKSFNWPKLFQMLKYFQPTQEYENIKPQDKNSNLLAGIIFTTKNIDVKLQLILSYFQAALSFKEFKVIYYRLFNMFIGKYLEVQYFQTKQYLKDKISNLDYSKSVFQSFDFYNENGKYDFKTSDKDVKKGVNLILYIYQRIDKQTWFNWPMKAFDSKYTNQFKYFKIKFHYINSEDFINSKSYIIQILSNSKDEALCDTCLNPWDDPEFEPYKLCLNDMHYPTHRDLCQKGYCEECIKEQEENE